MGCGGSSAAAALDPSASIEEKIKFQLEVVKKSLGDQLSDPAMMQEVLKGIVLFLNDSVQQASDPTFLRFLCYSMVGLQLAQRKPKSYPRQVQGGLFQLTDPTSLRYADLDHNFLEVKRVFKDVKAYQEKPREEGKGAGAFSSFAGSGGEPQPALFTPPHQDAQAGEPEDELDAPYVAQKKKMTEVLEPLCDLVDGLFASDEVKKRFCKSADVDEGVYLEQIKKKLGVALAVVKGFEPSKVEEGLKLCAFVGPESYGKSSLINYIVSGGESGVDFMPASEGMGTQVVCKIANKAPESLKLASNPRSTSGNVQAMVLKTIQAQRAKKERGEPLGSKDMDMMMAQKPFDTQGHKIELMDVPGIKTETAFHSELALSMCTSLVLVCGKPETLRMQLSSGDLALLVDIVSRIQPPVPIQCVASFNVKASDYDDAAEKNYREILNEFFPNSEQISIRWMNFHQRGPDGLDQGKRAQMVSTFFQDASLGSEKVMDPIKQFLDIEADVTDLTLKLHKFFATELEPYFRQSDEVEGPFHETKEAVKSMAANSDDAKKLVKEQLSEKSLQDKLGEVVLKDSLPEFFVSIGNKTMKDVPNVVLVIQDIWNEVRLAEIQWLTSAARDLHEGVFLDKLFDALAQEIMVDQRNALRKFFTSRVADTFRLFGSEQTQSQGKKEDRGKMAFWIENCSSQIAPYLEENNFTWFLAGFYLISSDSKNKHQFMNPFRQEKTQPERQKWRDDVMAKVEAIPFPQWVKRCKDNKGHLYQTICECAKEGCEQVREIANDLRVLTDPNCHAMTELVEITYVLLERLFIRMKGGYGSQDYTEFGRYVKRNIGGVSELKEIKDKLDTTSDAELGNMFGKALKEMGRTSNSTVSGHWKAKMDEEMPRIIQKISQLGDMLSRTFNGDNEQAILLLPSETRKYTTEATFPHSARFLNAGVDDTSLCFNAVAPEKQDSTFPTFCLAQMSGAGYHVAIYFRRGDTASYDPLPAERDMLRELRRQPRITKIFVLWTPPSPRPWNDSPFVKNWNFHEGMEQSPLSVELVTLSDETNSADFYKVTVATACRDAKMKAEQNLQRIREEMQKLKKQFIGYVEDYCDELSRSKGSTPASLHKLMQFGGDARKELEKLRTAGKVKPKTPKFEIPEASFLKNHFMGTGVDKLVGESQDGALESLDELRMRSFLYTVMIGQTLKYARQLAAQVYKRVFLPILDYIASSQFFASAQQILEALQEFNEQPDQQARVQRDDLQAVYLKRLQELFSQEAFEHAYAGYVTYQLMPVMYASVLAKLHEQSDFRVTAEYHRDHYLRAMSMLGDKADPSFKFKHEVKKGVYDATAKLNDTVISNTGAKDDVV